MAGRALAVVCCVAAFLAGATVTWLLGGQIAVPRPQPLVSALRQPVSKVEAIGRIQPASGVIRVAGPAGERLVKLNVDLHKKVAKGDDLAVFESFAVREAEYQAATQALADAQAQKSDIIQDAETKRKQLDAEQSALEGTFARQRQSQALRIELLNSTHKDAESLLRDLKQLQNSSAVTRREIAAQKLVLEQADVELKVARLTEQQLAQEFEQGKERLRLEKQAIRDGERRAISALALPTLEKQIEVAREGRDRAIVKALADGTVVDVAAKVGEAPLGAFVRLADTRRMAVIAEVWESQSQKVATGQPVEITAGSLLDAPLVGTVSHVARIVRSNEMTSLNPRAPTDGHVFEVEILLDEKNSALADELINLQVDVSIQTGKEPAGTSVARR